MTPLKDSILSFLVKITNMGLVFGTSMFAAKLMGPTEFGHYSYIISTLLLIAIPTRTGLPILVLRESSISVDTKDWHTFYSVRKFAHRRIFLFTFFIIICIGLFAATTDRIKNYSALDLITYLVIIVSLSYLSIVTSSLQALKNTFLSQIPELICLPLVLIVSITLLWYYNVADAQTLLIAHAIGGILAYIVGALALAKRIPPKPTTLSYDGTWQRAVIPLSILGAIQVVNMQADLVIVGMLQGPTAVGIYKIATQFSAAMSLPVTAIALVASPHISSLYRGKKDDELRNLLRRATRAGFITSVVAIVFVAFLSKLIVQFFLGDSYVEAIPAILIFCASNIAMGAFGLVLSVANMVHLEKFSAIAAGLGVMLNILLCFILIPRFGLTGAALGTALSMIIWKSALALVIYRKANINTSIFS